MQEIVIDPPLPSVAARIGRAVALGWQVAQLFHSPVHRGPAGDPGRGDHLPGRSDFPGASQSVWLGEQIQSQVQQLMASPPQVLTEALADALAALTNPDRSRDATLDAVFTLHCRLLESLTVSDVLLGKAYGLGRAIAETSLLPANALTDEQRAAQFRAMFEAGRLITIKDWLADLKTLLPGHTAYAVSRSLHDWQPVGGRGPGHGRLGRGAVGGPGPGQALARTAHRRESRPGHPVPLRLPGRGPAGNHGTDLAFLVGHHRPPRS